MNVLPSVVAVVTPSKILAWTQILDPSLAFRLMVANTQARSLSSIRVLSPFFFLNQLPSFGMLITLSCLRSCPCHFEGLPLCVWIVLAMWTPITLSHKVVSIVMQVSSQLSKGLSKVSHLLLSALRNPIKGHALLCCPSGQCCHVVKVCYVCDLNVESSQVHLPLTLSHFPENVLTYKFHFTRPSTKLHCADLAVSGVVLSPGIV